MAAAKTFDLEVETPDGPLTMTFGTSADHDNAGAAPAGHLVCSNSGCDQVNRMVQIHEDTILPIHCGSCSTVLKCEHVWEPVEALAGTLSNPSKIAWEHCGTCGSDRNRVETAMPPIDLGSMSLAEVQTILNTPVAGSPSYTEQQTV